MVYAALGEFASYECDLRQVPPTVRQILLTISIATLAGGLAGCGTINERLAAGVSDAIPAWAGGLPADAPPRPGTARYDEYMKERERRRLLPASERDEPTQVQQENR